MYLKKKPSIISQRQSIRRRIYDKHQYKQCSNGQQRPYFNSTNNKYALDTKSLQEFCPNVLCCKCAKALRILALLYRNIYCLQRLEKFTTIYIRIHWPRSIESTNMTINGGNTNTRVTHIIRNITRKYIYILNLISIGPWQSGLAAYLQKI